MMLRKLLRTFVRGSRMKSDFKSRIKSLPRRIDDEEPDPEEVEDGPQTETAGGVSLQSINLTQSQKVEQLAKMHRFEELEDADSQAKKRYYLQQKKFAHDLVEKSEDERPPEKLVQRQKKDTLWGLGGELLRRKESSRD